MKSMPLFVALFAALAAGTVCAADEPAYAPAKAAAASADPLASARALIQQERWRDAISELERVSQTQSADWNNLMGYSHRKAKTPDLVAAQQFYDSALRIEPTHRGALEYSGELFLMKHELPQAKSRLAALETVCGKSCPEFGQLKTAISSYETTYPIPAR